MTILLQYNRFSTDQNDINVYPAAVCDQACKKYHDNNCRKWCSYPLPGRLSFCQTTNNVNIINYIINYFKVPQYWHILSEKNVASRGTDIYQVVQLCTIF